jgi:hypothetical protein
LEIGVDNGQMMVPVFHHMSIRKDQFVLMGIDVQYPDFLPIMMGGLGPNNKQQLVLVKENSLTMLPSLASEGAKFEAILLDGDHNYYTVSKELEYIEQMTTTDSIVVIDDYGGRWSENDLWYAGRPGYESNEMATKPVDTSKHGVKPAVDDFLASRPNWFSFTVMDGDPIVLKRSS